MRDMKILVVDIDGTISKVGERIKFLEETPKNWDAFYAASFKDEPIRLIIDLVYDLFRQGYIVFFFTGRRESCRMETKEWIHENFPNDFSYYKNFPNDFSYHNLAMRENNDHRADTEVKPEMMERYIANYMKESVLILEDRTSVVKKWRELGYTCLQVADGDF